MKFGQSSILNQSFKPLPEIEYWFDDVDNQSNTYFGSTNWTQDYWKGTLYPLKTKPTEYLNLYSKFFTTIELNTTFYRIPSPEQVIKWKNQTSDNFHFCPKIPAIISQSKLLGTDNQLWQEFGSVIQKFDNKLGSSFMQLPEHFDSSKFSVIEKLLHGDFLLNNTLIELRHESWFKNSEILKNLCALLGTKGHGLIITDTPGRQDVLHMNICCSNLLVRFVSNGILADDQLRISAWLVQIKLLIKKGINNIFFIFHHPDASTMIKIADTMKKSINDN
ncbi:MAG: DUF72 domain-containing protein [Saprospiraceae bacterium]